MEICFAVQPFDGRDHEMGVRAGLILAVSSREKSCNGAVVWLAVDWHNRLAPACQQMALNEQRSKLQ